MVFLLWDNSPRNMYGWQFQVHLHVPLLYVWQFRVNFRKSCCKVFWARACQVRSIGKRFLCHLRIQGAYPKLRSLVTSCIWKRHQRQDWRLQWLRPQRPRRHDVQTFHSCRKDTFGFVRQPCVHGGVEQPNFAWGHVGQPEMDQLVHCEITLYYGRHKVHDHALTKSLLRHNGDFEAGAVEAENVRIRFPEQLHPNCILTVGWLEAAVEGKV